MSASPSAPAESILSVRQVGKQFGATVALRNVDLDIAPGEIVGLMGENGAGKSTLVGLLSGVHQPDIGEISIGGTRVVFHNPHEAQVRGVATVYQQLALAPHLDVAENLFLGRLGPMTGFVRPGHLHARAATVLRDLGWEIDVYRRVGSLPTSDQQLVEVARAIASRVRVLLLDEPTSSLMPTEVAVLIRRVRELARSGIAVIFVSHQLDEVFDLVDSFVVLRDGQVALRRRKDETNREEVVRAMLGASYATVDHTAMKQSSAPRQDSGTGPLFDAATWSHPPSFYDLTFSLNKGDVLALTGLRGCGAVEVAASLFNQTATERAVISLGQAGPLSSGELIRRGVGYVPADRRRALFPDLSLRENLELARRVARAPSVDSVEAVIGRLAIRARDADVPVRHLSGGNQQKVLIGRWLVARINALILAEPTRGVDIGVRADIHRLLRELALDGLGILVVSFDADEIEAIATRVHVMHDGRIVRTLDGPQRAHDILAAVAQAASSIPGRIEA